mmetsp:Transcript_44477/g.128736  ORF Transcript_44477/g.128736 Transcript_44477/m.128736 type:complete len:225 (-) Transcript_44477:71-745(-)
MGASELRLQALRVGATRSQGLKEVGKCRSHERADWVMLEEDALLVDKGPLDDVNCGEEVLVPSAEHNAGAQGSVVLLCRVAAGGLLFCLCRGPELAAATWGGIAVDDAHRVDRMSLIRNLSLHLWPLQAPLQGSRDTVKSLCCRGYEQEGVKAGAVGHVTLGWLDAEALQVLWHPVQVHACQLRTAGTRHSRAVGIRHVTPGLGGLLEGAQCLVNLAWQLRHGR